MKTGCCPQTGTVSTQCTPESPDVNRWLCAQEFRARACVRIGGFDGGVDVSTPPSCNKLRVRPVDQLQSLHRNSSSSHFVRLQCVAVQQVTARTKTNRFDCVCASALLTQFSSQANIPFGMPSFSKERSTSASDPIQLTGIRSTHRRGDRGSCFSIKSKRSLVQEGRLNRCWRSTSQHPIITDMIVLERVRRATRSLLAGAFICKQE